MVVMPTATPLLDRSSRTGCHHEFKNVLRRHCLVVRCSEPPGRALGGGGGMDLCESEGSRRRQASALRERNDDGCSRYIGRVGALAVFLGIGAAVVATADVAAAKPANSIPPHQPTHRRRLRPRRRRPRAAEEMSASPLTGCSGRMLAMRKRPQRPASVRGDRPRRR